MEEIIKSNKVENKGYSINESFDDHAEKCIKVPLSVVDNNFESTDFFIILDKVKENFKKDFTGQYDMKSDGDNKYICYFYQ